MSSSSTGGVGHVATHHESGRPIRRWGVPGQSPTVTHSESDDERDYSDPLVALDDAVVHNDVSEKVQACRDYLFSYTEGDELPVPAESIDWLEASIPRDNDDPFIPNFCSRVKEIKAVIADADSLHGDIGAENAALQAIAVKAEKLVASVALVKPAVSTLKEDMKVLAEEFSDAIAKTVTARYEKHRQALQEAVKADRVATISPAAEAILDTMGHVKPATLKLCHQATHTLTAECRTTAMKIDAAWNARNQALRKISAAYATLDYASKNHGAPPSGVWALWTTPCKEFNPLESIVETTTLPAEIKAESALVNWFTFAKSDPEMALGYDATFKQLDAIQQKGSQLGVLEIKQDAQNYRSLAVDMESATKVFDGSTQHDSSTFPTILTSFRKNYAQRYAASRDSIITPYQETKSTLEAYIALAFPGSLPKGDREAILGMGFLEEGDLDKHFKTFREPMQSCARLLDYMKESWDVHQIERRSANDWYQVLWLTYERKGASVPYMFTAKAEAAYYGITIYDDPVEKPAAESENVGS